MPGRYMLPIVPCIVLLLFRGMNALERSIAALGSKRMLVSIFAKCAWLPLFLLLVVNGVWFSSFLFQHQMGTTRGLNGQLLRYRWSGFEESFTWIKKNTDTSAILASAYDPMYFLYTGRRAIRPAYHRSASYFYPYGDAQPDVGSVAEIERDLKNLPVDYLIVDPMDGYAEGPATLKLFDDLVASYGPRAQLVFTSSDGKHRIYQLARR